MYWIAMGLVLSHLSIAKIAGTSSALTDCVNCKGPQAVEFPKPILAKDQDFLSSINQSLHSNATGFLRGRPVGGALAGGLSIINQFPALGAVPVATAASAPVFTQYTWPRYTMPETSSAQNLPGASMVNPASRSEYVNSYMSNPGFVSALTAFGYSPMSFARMF